MNQVASVSVPVEHFRCVHEIEATSVLDPDEVALRDLVEAVAEFSLNEREVVATVLHMLRTGRVRLQRPLAEPPVAKIPLCG